MDQLGKTPENAGSGRRSGDKTFEKSIDLPRWIKHPYLLLWTLQVLIRNRPRGLVVQNPSIVLSAWAVLLKRVFRYVLVVDAHNEGLAPFLSRSSWLHFMCRFIQRKADLTVVTNPGLAEHVKQEGGTPFVLEDKLPAFPEGKRMDLEGKVNIVCISTFAKDEPYREIIEAARRLIGHCHVYVTGSPRKVSGIKTDRLPSNLILTGYLSNGDYIMLLRSADIILDLTYMDDCLVCGAYEAVSLEKPVILTDTVALRKYFHRGTVFTENTAQEISEAVRLAISQLPSLREDVKVLKKGLEIEWAGRRNELVSRLSSMVH